MYFLLKVNVFHFSVLNIQVCPSVSGMLWQGGLWSPELCHWGISAPGRFIQARQVCGGRDQTKSYTLVLQVRGLDVRSKPRPGTHPEVTVCVENLLVTETHSKPNGLMARHCEPYVTHNGMRRM